MILHDLIESFLVMLEGGVGVRLRYLYYRRRLGACGKNVRIDAGVRFVNPKDISIGDDVWIDRNVVIIAGKVTTHDLIRRTHSHVTNLEPGKVRIGKFSHIGLGTIIQGHGGVHLSEYCTTSPGCKIYSLSNDVSECRTGTIRNASYVIHPVSVGPNTWLGLNSTILGHTIGSNCFIKPYTLVTCDIPENSVFSSGSQSGITKRFKD